jgi:hypothetical protein
VTHFLNDSDGDHVCGSEETECEITGTLRFDELKSSFTQTAIGTFRSEVVMRYGELSRHLHFQWDPFEAPDNGNPRVCEVLEH